MPEIDAQIAAFLADSGWSGARLVPVAGDLSQRRYFRLDRGVGDTAILMDATADPASARKFRDVGKWLLTAGLSAPELLADAADKGLLIVEDFGDQTAGARLSVSRGFATGFYDACIDLLLEIRHMRPPALHRPDAAELAGWTELAATHYPGADAVAQREFRAVLETALRPFLDHPVVSLRDFHAENLMWLPDREGIARLGLLDFQDAFLTHPVYDLVSLLTDARTQVPRLTRETCIQTYSSRSGDDAEGLEAAFALFSAQRNMRILGIFARAARSGKPRHLTKLPRVHTYLAEALEHPVFDAVRGAVLDGLPDPQTVTKALTP